ncbi:MAG: hypothetical protein J6Y37_12620 [Paludibacteraceae bacterium]|nr:hypothetical protein [Paludibacteraceae bacterium]
MKGETIEKKLNDIYQPLGKTFKVVVEERFGDGEEYDFVEDGLTVEGSGVMETETAEMSMLKVMYNEERGFSKEENQAYLFLLPKSATAGVLGDMPRNKPVGYVFADPSTVYADGHTVAHEIGHGIFTFDHAFEYYQGEHGQTDNLMDYKEGTNNNNLKVWQWSVMDTHKNYVLPFLEADEDGMALTNGWYFTWIGDEVNGWAMDDVEDLVEEHERLLREFDNDGGSADIAKEHWMNVIKENITNITPDDVINNIHEGIKTDISLPKNHVWTFISPISYEEGYASTKMKLLLFKDNVVLKNYKISSVEELAEHKYVRSAYYFDSGDKTFGVVAFYNFENEKSELQCVLLIDIKEQNDKETVSLVMNKWVEFLLFKNGCLSNRQLKAKTDPIAFTAMAQNNILVPKSVDMGGVKAYSYLYEDYVLYKSPESIYKWAYVKPNNKYEISYDIFNNGENINYDYVSSSECVKVTSVANDLLEFEVNQLGEEQDVPCVLVRNACTKEWIGAINMIVCPPISINLKFVVLNGKNCKGEDVSCRNFDFESAKKYLNDIYGAINVTFNYSLKNLSDFDYKRVDKNNNDKIDVDARDKEYRGSIKSDLSEYFQSNTYICFISALPSDDPSCAGIAARINDINFSTYGEGAYPNFSSDPYVWLFDSVHKSKLSMNESIAHELGHAIFGLSHPFVEITGFTKPKYNKEENKMEQLDDLNIMNYQVDQRNAQLRAYQVLKIHKKRKK